jgi:alkanesulfonate monooxygenase SsuD/methylene tetrahydromethanopterin reductase-like flavin-dependent oxidoreductase (luciferase family)
MSRFVTSDPGAAGRPIQTAKLVASVDQVSNGRFLFHVGGGWSQDEMEDHGTVFESRFKLTRERIRR